MFATPAAEACCSDLFRGGGPSSTCAPRKADKVAVFVCPTAGDFKGSDLCGCCLDRLHLPSGSGGSPTGQGHTWIDFASPAARLGVVVPRSVISWSWALLLGVMRDGEEIGRRSLTRCAGVFVAGVAPERPRFSEDGLGGDVFDDAFFVCCTSRLHAVDVGVFVDDGTAVMAMARWVAQCFYN